MTAVSIAAGRTVASLLDTWAERQPEREFLVYEDSDGAVERFSWAEMAAATKSVAGQLQGLGIRRGSMVNLHLANCPAFLAAWFACARLGAVIVPTNTASSPAELEYVLSHCAASASVVDAAGAGVVDELARRLGSLRHVLRASELDLGGAAGATFEPVGDLDEAAVLYTSGTTSRPKGVVLTHANYVCGGETVAHAMGLRRDDRFLTVLPLFHGNAQYYSVMSSLVAGATVLLGDRFSASRYFPLAIRHAGTVGSLFAAPIRMLLAQPEDPRLRDNPLRLVLFAQNLTDAHVDQWTRRFGAPLVQLYGMTETIGTPTMSPVDGSARADSIGRVTLGYVCRVVAEDGGDARPGEPGELLVGGVPGVSLMKGYLKDPEATGRTLVGGWLRSGDVVRTDGDGYLYFVDRTKDMIKRAGENVAASEVEAVIKLHPDVFDAAVVGVPDPIRDEAIAAFVVLREGASVEADEIVAWCSARLARFRVPSIVEFRAELPRTSVGKIQNHVLKADLLY